MTERLWLLTQSCPVCLAVGTYSALTSQRGEHIRGYFVPDSCLTMDVGWQTLPGFVWGECEARRNMFARNPVPFWLRRHSLFRRFNLTTVSLPSCAYPSPSVLAASPGQTPSASASIPASRIEDQSLPWGKCFNPSPGAVGMTPTPESSSQAIEVLLLSARDQSPNPSAGLVSGQRLAPLPRCSSVRPLPPVRTSTTPRAASRCHGMPLRFWAHHRGFPLLIAVPPPGASGS
jgi:hypothetical protein